MATDPNDPSVVLSQLYTAVKAKAPAIVKAELESALSDIRPITTITGASTLEIDVIDPDWLLLTSGFLDAGDDGKLDAVELNYPAGSNFYWRLVTLDASTPDPDGGSNLTLTFEDREVSYAREHKGQKSWSRSQFTRAQAIKSMTADEIKLPPKPIFVSPELDQPQAVQA